MKAKIVYLKKVVVIDYDPERSSLNSAGHIHFFLPDTNTNLVVGFNNPNLLYIEYEVQP